MVSEIEVVLDENGHVLRIIYFHFSFEALGMDAHLYNHTTYYGTSYHI